MKKRFVSVREQVADGSAIFDALVSRAFESVGSVGAVNAVVHFSFLPPKGGWIELRLTANDAVASFSISNVMDPFLLSRRPDSQKYFMELVPWLEAVAQGRPSAIVMDMEGKLATIILSPLDPSEAVLSVYFEPGGVELNVRVNRRAFVIDFYAAINSFWDSEVLKRTWLEWSKMPQWVIRSSILEGSSP